MEISLPSDLEGKFGANEVRLDLAVGMYAAQRVTLGRGAEIAGVSQVDFQRELARRRIPLHYDLADLQADLQAVRELSGK